VLARTRSNQKAYPIFFVLRRNFFRRAVDLINSGSDGDGGVLDPGTGFSFMQADGLEYVRQGQTQNITINITRHITPGNDITIKAISGVPDHVTVESLIIPSGSSTGHLVVTVDKSVPQGPLSVELQGLAAGATVTANTNLQLFVRGAPGTLDTTFANGGVYEDTLNDYTSVAKVVPQSNGTILISAWNDIKNREVVIRLNADGVADATLSESDIKISPTPFPT
jgi:hypothetical protein